MYWNGFDGSVTVIIYVRVRVWNRKKLGKVVTSLKIREWEGANLFAFSIAGLQTL